jgi:hypothetical protein
MQVGKILHTQVKMCYILGMMQKEEKYDGFGSSEKGNGLY